MKNENAECENDEPTCCSMKTPYTLKSTKQQAEPYRLFDILMDGYGYIKHTR